MTTLDNRLRAARKAAGKTLLQVAEETGINFVQLSRMETGQRDLKVKHLRSLGRSLKCPPEDIIAPVAEVPVVGTIGAAGQVFELRKNASGREAADVVKAPRGIDIAAAAALRVTGKQCEPSLPEGWVAFYEPQKAYKTVEQIGALCVVRLENGRSWLRQVKRGSQSGRYNLLSPFAPMTDDAVVQWCAPVLLLSSPAMLDLGA